VKAIVNKDDALKIALDDARRVYGDMSLYSARINFEGGQWRVVFVLKDPKMQGGGPSYVISSDTGQIVHKVYGQ
jgi:hypothetical protein